MELRRIFRMGWVPTVILFLILLSSYPARADTCEKWVARAVSIQGTVQTLRQGEKQWVPVRLHDLLCPGDRIRVLARSRADLLLINESTLRLDQHTTVTFSQPETEKTSLIELLKGAVHFLSRQRRNLKVVTPFVNATVEGTEFLITVETDRTFLSVFEGRVAASNRAGEAILSKDQSAIIVGDQAPLLQTVARPRDAIQWTLHYLPVLDYRTSDFEAPSPASWQARIQRSLQFFREGNLEGALENVSEIMDEVRNPRFFTYRASLLLSVGRVNEAGADIEKALHLKPRAGHALALQSIIAVVQNEKQKALDLAEEAVKADPQSAPPRIALSYALQARFDLEGALTSLKEAVTVEPDNALAWARLSELHLSLGNLREAFKAAEKASSLNPGLSRTQTVLGYAYLHQVKIKESKAAFEKAILLDQGDPLPRLGLGLAMIRSGDLKEGRGEIEIAASLDPDNSLTRSYLGKAYFEEKRDELAAGQLTMAKGLDPLDPTPHFYDAIRKQATNRPVEALEDMQTSIALNDNRAVYRSRLLLDEDLAARSASLARIYSDLGFQALALVEGWRSLNADPGNFSAHRFLADSYSVLPRHEIARVSELLQSQLLQPVNITPLQPHLGQGNLFILSGAGPSGPSFNEFNPLFNRDRITLQASGIVGGNSTLGDEVVLAGIHGPVSFSIGQFHYDTNGFRTNNDLKEDIYNAFLQVSPSPWFSLQGEIWSKKSEFGDLTLRFRPEDFLMNRQEEKTQGGRLGFRFTLFPGSDFIGSLIYQGVDYTNRTATPDVFHINGYESSASGEVQYLFRSRALNVTAGIGYFQVDRNEKWSLIMLGPPLTPLPLLYDEKEIHHTNLYLYSYINYLKNVTLTLGASADLFRGGLKDRSQLNPKLGLTWNPFPSTTLRGAAFRTFRRTLINNQTIEPTQVAGFNQFFDDENSEGADAWRYGFALDQKILKNLSGGIEYSVRDLKVPYLSYTSPALPQVLKADWEERLARAYLFWTPHPWLGLSAEYQYERMDRGKESGLVFAYASTDRFPLGVSFYHPSGLSAILKATYYDQKGLFKPAYYDPANPYYPGDDRFWLLDLAISYRLPKRLGFITVGAKNLLNRDFHHQDTDSRNPQIQPERFIYTKATLAF